MLVKRTSKNQFTLPKAFLHQAGIQDKDMYFDAAYDGRRHIIYLKPVQVVVEESLPQKAIDEFEKKALRVEAGEKTLKSRKAADEFLRRRAK